MLCQRVSSFNIASQRNKEPLQAYFIRDVQENVSIICVIVATRRCLTVILETDFLFIPLSHS